MPHNRPNILLLHTDQQRFDTIRALGATHMVTPNMDRLMRMGTTFTRAYASNPLCMPCRHDLITGVSARHHGYYGNSNKPMLRNTLSTLPRLLTEAGYDAIAVGKMHFRPERELHGFGAAYLMEELPACREGDAYLTYLQSAGYGHVRCQHGVRPLFYHTPQVSLVPEQHHGSAWVAHQTIEEVRIDRDRPFFLFASWVGPHPPYSMPKAYLDQYKDKAMPAPSPVPEDRLPQYPPSPDDPDPGGIRLKRLREAYCGAITLVDRHIGRILDALEDTGKLDDTLIILTSDHGEMLGDRGNYQKHSPYEGSAHIPLLLCGPGMTKNAICTTPVTTWDTSATILETAGATLPSDPPLIGTSLRAIAASRHDGRIVTIHHGEREDRYVCSIHERYKWIHWFHGGREECYDLSADPQEQHNLILHMDASAREAVHALRQAAIAFEATHGVKENVRNGRFVDRPLQARPPMAAGLYPYWSSRQFPRWMRGFSNEDLRAIAEQMRGCLAVETAHIFRDPAWRRDAVEQWRAIGGDPAVYQALFRAVDKR